MVIFHGYISLPEGKTCEEKNMCWPIPMFSPVPSEWWDYAAEKTAPEMGKERAFHSQR